MTTEQILQTIKDLTPMILPLLPYLVKGAKSFGSEMVKSAGEKMGEKIPDVIKNIWEKLVPKVKETPGAEKTIEKVVQNPNDQRAIGAFELILEDILSDDDFRKDLVNLLQVAKDQGITVEQVTHIGKLFGEITNVDVEDAGSLSMTNIKSELNVDEIEKGGKATGVRLGSKKSKG
ncbi:MAG: hypothetical protein U0X74_15700 [Anaerolineales bacterium]